MAGPKAFSFNENAFDRAETIVALKKVAESLRAIALIKTLLVAEEHGFLEVGKARNIARILLFKREKEVGGFSWLG